MKRPITYVTLTALLCCAAAAIAQTPAQDVLRGWKKIEISGVKSAWVHPSSPGHMVTIVEHASPKPQGFKDASRKDIAIGISSMRKLALEKLGFTNWELKEFNYSKKSTHEEVEMSGSYRRPDKVAVQYFEQQYYIGKNFVQVSYMAESATALKNKTEIDALLRKLAPKGIAP